MPTTPITIEQGVNQIKEELKVISTRVAGIETKVAVIETKLEYMATKGDVEHMGRILIMWVVGSIIAMFGLLLGFARFIK